MLPLRVTGHAFKRLKILVQISQPGALGYRVFASNYVIDGPWLVSEMGVANETSP